MRSFLGGGGPRGRKRSRSRGPVAAGSRGAIQTAFLRYEAPELEASALLGMGNAAGAQQVLAASCGNGCGAGRPGFQLAQGEVALAQGQTAGCGADFQAAAAGTSFEFGGADRTGEADRDGRGGEFDGAELRSLGDAYYNAGRYELGGRAIPEPGSDRRPGCGSAQRFCGSRGGVRFEAEAAEHRPRWRRWRDTSDDNGARRMYLLMELARNRDDLGDQKRIVAQMESSFPQSQWLAEALFSSGNMYLLRRDYPAAVEYYSYLATHFPENTNAAAAHWRAGWLSYRQGLYADAARLFDEQIRLYPAAKETVSAIYWRGRLYETQDHKPANAAANYRALVRAYQHFFYAQMARQRLAALGDAKPVAQPQLDRLQAAPVPVLAGELSGGQPAFGQGAAAGQRRLERLHCAGDRRRSGFRILERAGRGADLYVVWRDVSRHALR